MTEAEPVEQAAAPGRWAGALWWATLAAAAAVVAWDAQRVLGAAGGTVGVVVGEIFPLVVPLGLAWWGRRSDNAGFGVLALAVLAVEVLVIRLRVL
jgi:hypothetical protein